MHDVRVFVFGTFLKPHRQLQTTGSPRLLNRFWCFLMQNEEEVLLVLFLFSTVYFYRVEKDENFGWTKKTVFSPSFFVPSRSFAVGRSEALMGKMSPKWRNYAILSRNPTSGHSKQLNEQVLWISAQTEQYKSCGAYTSPKPRIWTAYCGAGTTCSSWLIFPNNSIKIN